MIEYIWLTVLSIAIIILICLIVIMDFDTNYLIIYNSYNVVSFNDLVKDNLSNFNIYSFSDINSSNSINYNDDSKEIPRLSNVNYPYHECFIIDYHEKSTVFIINQNTNIVGTMLYVREIHNGILNYMGIFDFENFTYLFLYVSYIESDIFYKNINFLSDVSTYIRKYKRFILNGFISIEKNTVYDIFKSYKIKNYDNYYVISSQTTKFIPIFNKKLSFKNIING